MKERNHVIDVLAGCKEQEWPSIPCVIIGWIYRLSTSDEISSLKDKVIPYSVCTVVSQDRTLHLSDEVSSLKLEEGHFLIVLH